MAKIKEIINIAFSKRIRNQTVFFIIAIVFMVSIFYGQQLKAIRTQEVLNQEWKHIEIAFDIAYREAIDMNTTSIVEMEQEVEEEYGSDFARLESDLKSIQEINTLTELFSKNAIQGVYLLDIHNDNNDPFIMNKEMILLDSSANCSANVGSSRSFEIEVYDAGGCGHFNKILACKALEDIVDGNKQYAIWSFLSVDESLPWYEDVKDMTYVDMTVLKELFYKYEGDIRALESFEILVPSYIYRDEDLLGNPLTTINGYKNENYQLILVQGFNITDVLDKLNYTDFLNNDYNRLSEFNNSINLATIGIMGFLIIYFMVMGNNSNKRNNVK